MDPRFDIPEEHKSTLLRMCGLPPDGELPSGVLMQYMIAKQSADRVGLYMNDSHMLSVILCSLHIKEAEKPKEPTVADMYRAGLLKSGDKVFCVWRKQSNVEAVILGISPDDRILVRFKGKTEEYKLPVDAVSAFPVTAA